MKVEFSMPVIIVRDIERSKRFYQDLFDLVMEHDFGENISFTCGLSLWERKRAHGIIFGIDVELDENDPPKDIELYFQADDLESMMEKVEASGAVVIHQIKEEPWGQRNIRFYDPDGFIIEVGEPIPVFVKRMREEGLSLEEVIEKSQMPAEEVKRILG